jgi:hypothetical protein
MNFSSPFRRGWKRFPFVETPPKSSPEMGGLFSSFQEETKRRFPLFKEIQEIQDSRADPSFTIIYVIRLCWEDTV